MGQYLTKLCVDYVGLFFAPPCVYWRLTDDQRPTSQYWKISNGDISTTGHSIQFMFGSAVFFSGLADRMALFPVGPNSVGLYGSKQCARSKSDWSQSKIFLV